MTVTIIILNSQIILNLEVANTAQLMSVVGGLACHSERPASPSAYLIVSKQEEKYAEAFGVFDSSFFDRLNEGLRTSKVWSSYFVNQTTHIYRLSEHCVG